MNGNNYTKSRDVMTDKVFFFILSIRLFLLDMVTYHRKILVSLLCAQFYAQLNELWLMEGVIIGHPFTNHNLLRERVVHKVIRKVVTPEPLLIILSNFLITNEKYFRKQTT